MADRRTVLGWLATASATVGAALVGIPGVAALLDPLLRREEGAGGWRDLCPEPLVPRGHPMSLPVVGDIVDAWTRAEDQVLGTVWLRRKADGGIAALSAECPHLGCKVGFSKSESHFTCPCHESAFGLDGEVLTGPSPRGLDPLEARVREGRVEVRFKRFRTQISERVEVG